MRIIKGGITAPKGFLASAVSCGIRESASFRPGLEETGPERCEEDLALLYSELPASSVGVFTTNRIKSESVVVTKRKIKNGTAQAIIVNSGNANCCIGNKGIKDAETITNLTGKHLGIDEDRVLIASTGVIGRPLPVEKIKRKIPQLIKRLTHENGKDFARAIMTTDTFAKEVAFEFELNGKKTRLGGVAKGSGMISPHMATMLAFFTTDAQIQKELLDLAFRRAIENSFNCISVDGDMSTNDTAIILANGSAENKIIERENLSYRIFCEALERAAIHLAKLVVKDGEGAKKFIEIIVENASNECDAKKVARRIANSNLIKTMIAGGDPNWGRIAAACGSAEVDIAPKKLDVFLGKQTLKFHAGTQPLGCIYSGVCVLKNGESANANRGLLKRIFKGEEIQIRIDLEMGRGFARMWTCDLTEEYVRINSAYET